MSKLEKFLQESNLSDEAKSLILEAWNEEKQVIAAEIRVELKERYESDKAEIIGGLQKLSENVIKDELSSLYEEKRKLHEDRKVIRSNLTAFSKFANDALVQEVKKYRQDRQSLSESLVKFSEFTNSIIRKELNEFHQDRQSLVETKVKLMAESKRKFDNTARLWIEKTTQEAAKFINESTKNEFVQLRHQLEEAKRNTFGRKLFEAFKDEFKDVMFNEHAELKNLNDQLLEAKAEAIENGNRLLETRKELIASNHKISIMEDMKTRQDTLNSLMKPLTFEQKSIMEGLLASTPTDKIEADFNKYLRPVLNETSVGNVKRKSVSNNTNMVLESQQVVTGNRNTVSTAADDLDFNNELEKIIKIAGI